MPTYRINPALVYQQGSKRPVTFAIERTNYNSNISVTVRDFSNGVSFA